MRSDKDMPLNATSVEEKRPVFRPTGFQADRFLVQDFENCFGPASV